MLPAYLTSASGLIKNLKAASDPPQSGFPLKIDIALEAWQQDSFHVPRKADVLRDWVIETWTRNHKGSSPLADAKYYRLLLEVSPRCDSPAQAPLTIIPSLLKSLPQAQDLDSVLDLAVRSLNLLFPPQQTSHKAEAWTDVWTGILQPLSLLSLTTHVLSLTKLVSSRVEESLSSSLNGKKLAAAVVASFPSFCNTILRHPSLLDILAPTMSAVLFQESVLQSGDPLQPLLSQVPSPGSHLAIPVLFDALVQKYHQNRYSIFTQASSSKVAHDVFVAGKEREAVRLALERTLDRLNGGDITAWQTRFALWKTIELWGGYMEREPSWSRLLDIEAQATKQALNSGDPSTVGTLLGTLVSLERLDHDQAKLGPDVVRWCLASPVAHHTIAKSLISSSLRFFHLTHSLPTFFELILDALDGLFTSDLPEEIIISLYDLTLDGPLTSESIRQEIDQSLRSTLGGQGRSNIWDQILRSLIDRITPLLRTQPVGKKRKRSSSPSFRSAALIGIHTRLISYCLISSGTSPNIGSSLQSVKELSALIEDWPIRNDTDPSFSAAVTESGRVRVARNVESLTSAISAITVPGLHRSAIPELSIESIRFILHRAVFDQSIPSETIDALLDILPEASSAVWQIVIDQGIVLLDCSASPNQLNRLATLIAQRVTKDSLLFTSGVFWELPNVRGEFRTPTNICLRPDALQIYMTTSSLDYYILTNCPPTYLNRKTKAHAIESTGEVAPAAPWLSRIVTEGDSVGLILRNNKVLRQVVEVAADGNEAAISLFAKLINLMIQSPDQNEAALSTIISSLVALGKPSPVAKFFSVIMRKEVQDFSSVLPKLLDLYISVKTLPAPAVDDLDAIDTRNVLCAAGRWLVESHQTARLGPRLCSAFLSHPEPRLARCVLETFASETTDMRHIIAAAMIVYRALPDHSANLDTALQSIFEGRITEAISCGVNFDRSSACLRILAALCMRCSDPAALRDAIDASLSSSADDPIIKFFERIIEDKAFALQHNDVVRLFPIITRSLDHQSLNSNIDVLISLSRRRPDLILANLPEVVDILSIMFKTLQRSRKLPSPAGDEPQRLSRLLVALTQMRLKTHETSPLAKHIPAILVAYVRAAADLHVGYTPSVRRDLEPGLYALCNLATTGGRAHARGREGEGLGTPFGLGEGPGGDGERELWADLWQNWSKSRYMGQG
ncbi:hypothetical protein I204_00696 [Kwoniella mangroviensis CBS 8886]|nr:hypothetical protein I204_00696 [Kwoniella mangroviensis CBS 8886]